MSSNIRVQMLLAGSRAATLAVLLLLGGCLANAQNEEQNRETPQRSSTMAAGSLAGVKVTGDYDRRAGNVNTRVNRFDARTGFVPSNFGNSASAITDRLSFVNVEITDPVVEFKMLSTGQTDLEVDFSTAGLVTLKRTELDTGCPSDPCSKSHDPVEMTFYSPTFTGLAGIGPAAAAVRVQADKDFWPNAVTASLDDALGFLSIKLSGYQRRGQGDTEVAVFQLLRNSCASGACCDIGAGVVKDPDTVCSASARQTCAQPLGKCDGVFPDCQLTPKCAGTECRAAPGSCKQPALCDGTSLLCGDNPNKPNGLHCPWHPISYPDGLLAGTSDAKTVSVSAKEAATRLQASPQYKAEWPECKGVCLEGDCTLEHGYPACCHVPQYGPYDVDAADDAKQSVDSASNVKVDLEGYWNGRDFWCWR